MNVFDPLKFMTSHPKRNVYFQVYIVPDGLVGSQGSSIIGIVVYVNSQ